MSSGEVRYSNFDIEFLRCFLIMIVKSKDLSPHLYVSCVFIVQPLCIQLFMYIYASSQFATFHSHLTVLNLVMQVLVLKKQFTIHRKQCTMHRKQCTLERKRCKIYRKMCNTQPTMYNTQKTMHSI